MLVYAIAETHTKVCLRVERCAYGIPLLVLVTVERGTSTTFAATAVDDVVTADVDTAAATVKRPPVGLVKTAPILALTV